jgi:endonuclease YncB( thermonuclease family)
MPKNPKSPKKLPWKKVVLTAGAVAIIAGSVGVVRRAIIPGEIVTEVFDGDSFQIGHKQTIRLLAVDAPELGNCFSQEAKDGLTKKVLGKRVVLQELKTDIYRRVMALVYVDGELVNEYMAKNGFALRRSDMTSQAPIILAANNFARENKLGIFSTVCSPLTPTKQGCDIKGQISYDTGKKYYITPDCVKSYNPAKVEKFRGEDWFCTEKEAKSAGFTKSPDCP